MKRKKAVCTILIFIVLLSTIFGILFITGGNQTKDLKNKDRNVSINYLKDKFKSKSSNGAKSLRYDSIIQNTTEVRRVYESINFTVNITDFKAEGGNFTVIHIFFTDGLDQQYNMTQIGLTNNFTYLYTPSYNVSLGFTLVNFDIFNATGNKSAWIRVNSGLTQTNFTIRANCMMYLEKTEYNRGQVLKADIVIDGSNDFTWSISVVDNNVLLEETTLFIVGNNLFYVNFSINESFAPENKLYYIKVNLTKKTSGRWAAPYFQFKVLLPESILIQSSITFNPTSIFRTQSCTLNLNVSAQEKGLSIGLINVTFILKDTNSKIVNNINLTRKADDTFFTSFSVVATSPTGTYTYVITTFYKNKEIEQYSGTFSVKNNLPDIDGYEINNYDTDESISVLYGEDLVFEFDVFDVEGVAYITLLLINEDDDEYEITREYEEDLEITVRTVELITGTWDIYVYVTDTDGVTVGLDDDFDTAPQKITIIPDTLGEMLSWIMLVLGLISGVLFGTAISYYILKSQKLKPEKEIEKKPKKEKIPRKVKPTPAKREVVEKLIEEEKPEKKEPKPHRKIKRKLK